MTIVKLMCMAVNSMIFCTNTYNVAKLNSNSISSTEEVRYFNVKEANINEIARLIYSKRLDDVSPETACKVNMKNGDTFYFKGRCK